MADSVARADNLSVSKLKGALFERLDTTEIYVSGHSLSRPLFIKNAGAHSISPSAYTVTLASVPVFANKASRFYVSGFLKRRAPVRAILKYNGVTLRDIVLPTAGAFSPFLPAGFTSFSSGVAIKLFSGFGKSACWATPGSNLFDAQTNPWMPISTSVSYVNPLFSGVPVVDGIGIYDIGGTHYTVGNSDSAWPFNMQYIYTPTSDMVHDLSVDLITTDSAWATVVQDPILSVF